MFEHSGHVGQTAMESDDRTALFRLPRVADLGSALADLAGAAAPMHPMNPIVGVPARPGRTLASVATAA